MDFSKVSHTDKLILMVTLGFAEGDIDSILKENIEDYFIDYETGKVSIVYKKPMEVLTMTIKL